MMNGLLKKCGKAAALFAAVAMVAGSTAALAAPGPMHGPGGHGPQTPPPPKPAPRHPRPVPPPPHHHGGSSEFIAGAVLGAVLGSVVGGALHN